MGLTIPANCQDPDKAFRDLYRRLERAEVQVSFWGAFTISYKEGDASVLCPLYPVVEFFSSVTHAFVGKLHKNRSDLAAWQSRKIALDILEQLRTLQNKGEEKINSSFFTKFFVYVWRFFEQCLYYPLETLIKFAEYTFLSFTDDQLSESGLDKNAENYTTITMSAGEITYRRLDKSFFLHCLQSKEKEAAEKKENTKLSQAHRSSGVRSPTHQSVTQASIALDGAPELVSIPMGSSNLLTSGTFPNKNPLLPAILASKGQSENEGDGRPPSGDSLLS